MGKVAIVHFVKSQTEILLIIPQNTTSVKGIRDILTKHRSDSVTDIDLDCFTEPIVDLDQIELVQKDQEESYKTIERIPTLSKPPKPPKRTVKKSTNGNGKDKCIIL
jgi:hypothetical protein